MSLTAGQRLGPYEILGPLGAGGMGEVWRARDTRLHRDVALKVLPDAVAQDPERLARFEREAQAVAALSHPSILALHDFGIHEGIRYAVMELLEGETLRQRLTTGALPTRKAVDYGVQIAQALAAAHDKGIVHRDLKPENLFITDDGQVKVLDFGLARVDVPAGIGSGTQSPTKARPTDPGTVLGTVGYMAPEQVRGSAADARSDLFALGSVLYEMLTGRRAFQRDTAAETLTAILREEPATLTSEVPSSIARIVERCLEKRPEERFQSARDLAFALGAASQTSTSGEMSASSAPRAIRGLPVPVALALAALVLAGALVGSYLLGRRAEEASSPREEPKFTRLSFGYGTVRAARFAPDGQTVVYGAAWNGEPIRLFLTRIDSSESTALNLPDAELLSVSPTGELAVSLGHRFGGWMGAGTLARVPLLGGGARSLLEGVREADWAPDGSTLAVVRRVEGRERLEYPMGKTIYDTAGYISHIRFSPDGKQIAFADHPIWADDVGSVAIIDLTGRKSTLTGVWNGLRGLAWSPSGQEVWFTAAGAVGNLALHAVDLSGRERVLLAGLTHMLLLDVSREGRVLLGRETHLRQVEALVAGQAQPGDFSLKREGSMSRFMSPDGGTLVLTDQSTKGSAVFLQRADGSPPVLLGEGAAYSMSDDGKWVLAITPDPLPRLLLHPTGPGESRELPNPDGILADNARWLPGERGIAVLGPAPGVGSRGYLFDPAGNNPPRPFTAEGVEAPEFGSIPASPDGTRIVARDGSGPFVIYRIDGGAPEPIPGLAEGDIPIEWTEDGSALYVGRRDDVTWEIRRLDLASGESTPWTEIVPSETAGLRRSQVYVTPNGRFWRHGSARLLTDLYVAEGLR